MSNKPTIRTLGELIQSGYKSKTIKEELRDNLMAAIQSKSNVFEGILGYEDTVIPDIERAILAGHNINLLGLRGQAKTRIARQMTNLLDEYVPVVAGSELNDDPQNPISQYGKEMLLQHGEKLPIDWLHSSSRYVEKLATPDVTVADLIGDIDPIKAANLKLNYSDYRVIHYGIIPRSNRCIFVINELPDLQARIQVALFNILQEGDVQIRGYQLRIPLDMQFLFTANPEDYTNRGSIITPLKDRIGSQILTHYPKDAGIGKQITRQEAKVSVEQKEKIHLPDLLENLIEQIAIEARSSEFVDAKSGVSARMTISAYEALVSTVERRLLHNQEKSGVGRISDLQGILSAIHGKVELVYEGEQEGAAAVAIHLVNKAIRNEYLKYFPDPSKLKKATDKNPLQPLLDWYAKGNKSDILFNTTKGDYQKELSKVSGLKSFVSTFKPNLDSDEDWLYQEFVLFALSEFSVLGKNSLQKGTEFSDLVGSIFSEDNFFKDSMN